MPSPLTGDFDVVMHGSVPTVEAGLAALHQAGDFPHTLVAPVHVTPSGVDGWANIQIATPTISLPSDPSRLTATFDVMAEYRATPGSVRLPETLHGKVRLTGALDQLHTEDSLVSFDPRAADTVVEFVPDSGAPLGGAELALVREVTEHVVRAGFPRSTVVAPLPSLSEIREWYLAALPGATVASLALGLRVLSAGTGSDVGPSQLRLGDDWALALSREFVEETVRDMAGRSGLPRVDVSTITVRTRPGGITMMVEDPGFVRVSQDFALATTGGSVHVVRAGDPRLRGLSVVAKGFLFLFGGSLRGVLRRRIDAVLLDVNSQLASVLGGGGRGGALGGLLGELPIEVRVHLTDAEVVEHGIVVRGDLNFGLTNPVVAKLSVSSHGEPGPDGTVRYVTRLDGFRSWIPGGTARRYRFQEWGRSTMIRERVEEHQFFTVVTRGADELVTVDPFGPGAFRRWCLRVEGTQGRQADGSARWVHGEICPFVGPLPDTVVMDSSPFYVRVEGPAGEIAAHVEVIGDRVGTSDYGTHLAVVHYSNIGEAAASLGEALATRENRHSAIYAVLITNEATPQPPSELRADLGVAWVGTDDPEANWRRCFGLDRQGFVLVAPDGEVKWRSETALDAKALRLALERYCRAPGAIRWDQTRLRVEPGGGTPECRFEYLGREVSVSNFTGAAFVMTFFTTWSDPCRRELHRLAGLRSQAKDSRFVAVNVGEPYDRVRQYMEAQKLDLPTVFDPLRTVTRVFGVRCLPTTIRIGADGVVQNIHFGAAPDNREPSLKQVGLPSHGA